MIGSPTAADLMPHNEAERLGILADPADRYALMRAISRCDELVSQIRAAQLLHSQDLCRVANRFAFGETPTET